MQQATREGVPKLLSFLQASRAAFRPLDPGPINLANEDTPEGVGWRVSGMCLITSSTVTRSTYVYATPDPRNGGPLLY